MWHLLGFALVFLLSVGACQHPKSTSSKGRPPEVQDLLQQFDQIPKESKGKALENTWAFFGSVFQYESFQSKVLAQFPSLGVYAHRPALLGKTPLDLRLLKRNEINPVVLLLAIDLEMEIISTFHNHSQVAPRCLETFWQEWGLPLPPAHKVAYSLAPTQRRPSQLQSLEGSPALPLNEKSRRLAIYARQSLGLASDARLKFVKMEDPSQAQFLVNGSDLYEIFSSPLECKSLQERNAITPLLGKMKCLQKQSATWITVPAKESTVLGDDWSQEVMRRCQKWLRPLSDEYRRLGADSLKGSPILKSWTLYPRLRNFILAEASRYDAAFRKALP